MRKLLRAVLLEHRAGSTLTRNKLEEAFLAICRAAELPPDAVNVWIPFLDGGGAEADFLYRERCLIVEVDGRDVHATVARFILIAAAISGSCGSAGASCGSPGAR